MQYIAIISGAHGVTSAEFNTLDAAKFFKQEMEAKGYFHVYIFPKGELVRDPPPKSPLGGYGKIEYKFNPPVYEDYILDKDDRRVA